LDDGNLVVTLVIHPVGSGSTCTVEPDEVISTTSSLKPYSYGRVTSIGILVNPHQCQRVGVSLNPGVFSNFSIIVPIELKVLGRVETLEAVITVVWVPHGTGMISVGGTV